MTSISGKAALDRHFLEARSKALDLAAILDRIGRGGGETQVREDGRLKQLRAALTAILDGGADRAQRVQMIFSLEYDAKWKKP
jgi:hypothetical protein